METRHSFLNEAHRYVRSAEKAVRRGNFDQAVAEQDQIVENLSSALLSAKDQNVRETIQLQIEHHKKQKQVIRLREARCHRIAKNLEKIHQRMEKVTLQDADNLQDSINRTFQETESLLHHLKQGTGQHQGEDQVIPQQDDIEKSTFDNLNCSKKPKDDKVIIEELQTANNHLRNMVETMFAELESYRRENAELRARVADLEAEKLVLLSRPTPAAVINTGPAPSMNDSANLPPLAPLEMPNFDFNAPHQPMLNNE